MTSAAGGKGARRRRRVVGADHGRGDDVLWGGERGLGPGGTDLNIDVIGAHLAPGGAAVLQLGYAEQVGALASAVASNGLEVIEQRSEERGVLVRLARAALVG